MQFYRKSIAADEYSRTWQLTNNLICFSLNTRSFVTLFFQNILCIAGVALNSIKKGPQKTRAGCYSNNSKGTQTRQLNNTLNELFDAEDCSSILPLFAEISALQANIILGLLCKDPTRSIGSC